MACTVHSVCVPQTGEEGATAPQPSHEDTHLQEQHRQASILKHMYPKSHHLLDAQLGPSLTPVLEEEVDMSNPLPPLPGESCLPPITENSPLPPLPGEFPSPPVPSVSPLPPLPGEISPSPVLPEVAALASVRDSVRELKDLEEQMGGDAPTPPQTHSSPSPHLLSTPSQGMYTTFCDHAYLHKLLPCFEMNTLSTVDYIC